MCFGLPMRILSVDGVSAVCEGMGRQETISLALIGDAKPGEHVLCYLGSAVQRLEESAARDIAAAIQAVTAASEGRDYEHLLQDLIDREPELPAHLRPGQVDREDTNHASATPVTV